MRAAMRMIRGMRPMFQQRSKWNSSFSTVVQSSYSGGGNYRVNTISRGNLGVCHSSSSDISGRFTTSSDSESDNDSASASAGSPDKVRAVVGDLAGTFQNNFSTKPAEAFDIVFGNAKLPITKDEARGPTGISKGEHMWRILRIPRITKQILDNKCNYTASITSITSTSVTVDDILQFMHTKLMSEYQGIQEKLVTLPDPSNDLILGVKEAIHHLQRSGVSVGATTGYYSNVSNIVRHHMAKSGVHLQACVAADELPKDRSRPHKDGVLECLKRMGFYLPEEKENILSANLIPIKKRQVIKVDDTVDGIKEGKNAGVFTVGVYGTSVGMDVDSEEHFRSLPLPEQVKRLGKSYKTLRDAGADYVAPSAAHLPQIIDLINRRLQFGQGGMFEPGSIFTMQAVPFGFPTGFGPTNVSKWIEENYTSKK